MNTAATITTTDKQAAPQLVSATARFAVAVAVAAGLAAAWVGAGHESEEAVKTSYSMVNATRVTLPTVYVYAPATPAKVSAKAAAGNLL